MLIFIINIRILLSKRVITEMDVWELLLIGIMGIEVMVLIRMIKTNIVYNKQIKANESEPVL